MVSLLDKGLVFLPVLMVMNRLFGANGIAFSHAVTMIVSVVIALLMAGQWTKALKEEEGELE